MRNRFIPGDLALVGMPHSQHPPHPVMIVYIEEPANTDPVYTVLTRDGSYQKVYSARHIRPVSRIPGAQI